MNIFPLVNEDVKIHVHTICTYVHTYTHTYIYAHNTNMHAYSFTHTYKMSIQTQIHWYLKSEVKKPNYIDTIQISVNNWASSLLDLLVLLWPGYAYSTSCWFNWLSPLSPSPVHIYLKYVSPGIINLQDWCGCWASISVTWFFCLFVWVCVVLFSFLLVQLRRKFLLFNRF